MNHPWLSGVRRRHPEPVTRMCRPSGEPGGVGRLPGARRRKRAVSLFWLALPGRPQRLYSRCGRAAATAEFSTSTGPPRSVSPAMPAGARDGSGSALGRPGPRPRPVVAAECRFVGVRVEQAGGLDVVRHDRERDPLVSVPFEYDARRLTVDVRRSWRPDEVDRPAFADRAQPHLATSGPSFEGFVFAHVHSMAVRGTLARTVARQPTSRVLIGRNPLGWQNTATGAPAPGDPTTKGPSRGRAPTWTSAAPGPCAAGAISRRTRP